MVDSGMSAADFAALTNAGDGFGNGGGWLWFIIVLFCVFGGGFWGGNAVQATSADVQRGEANIITNDRFNTLQSTQTQNAYDNAILIKDSQYANLQNTNTLTNSMNAGFNSISSQLCCGFNGVDKSIMESTYATTQAMNNGFNGVQNGLCEISHQITDGICALKTQMLQDKYDSLLNDYNLSTLANSNAVQTQNILSTLGSWYAKPPYAPYAAYQYGTTVG